MVLQAKNNDMGGSWLIDSGCTSHMSKDKSLFRNLDKSVKTRARLGNGKVVQAQGKGSVVVHTKQGTKFINDVLYIPCLAQNLLSVA